MIQVNISQFRSNLLKYLKHVQQGEHVNVTSKGALLATVVPPVNHSEQAKAALSTLAATAVIHDVLSPLDNDWDLVE